MFKFYDNLKTSKNLTRFFLNKTKNIGALNYLSCLKKELDNDTSKKRGI